MKEAQNDQIDLRSIFNKLLRNWYWFVLCVGVAGALAVAYLKTAPRIYAIEATMLMKDETSDPSSSKQEFMKGMGVFGSNGEIEDQIAVLTSRSNISKTLKRLDFDISYYETKNFRTVEKYDYPPFYIKLDSASMQIVHVPIYVEPHLNDSGRVVSYRIRSEGKNIETYAIRSQEVSDEFLKEIYIDTTFEVGVPFIANHLAFDIEFPEDRIYDADEYYFTINSLEGLVQSFRSDISVEPLSKESNVIVISSQLPVVTEREPRTDENSNQDSDSQQ